MFFVIAIEINMIFTEINKLMTLSLTYTFGLLERVNSNHILFWDQQVCR